MIISIYSLVFTSPYPFQDRLCGPNVHLENILQFPIIIQIRVGDRLRLAGGAMGRRTRVAYRLGDLIMRSYFQIIAVPHLPLPPWRLEGYYSNPKQCSRCTVLDQSQRRGDFGSRNTVARRWSPSRPTEAHWCFVVFFLQKVQHGASPEYDCSCTFVSLCVSCLLFSLTPSSRSLCRPRLSAGVWKSRAAQCVRLTNKLISIKLYIKPYKQHYS